MLDSLFIGLEAHHDALNHHRRYEISVGRDLLGDWVVTVRYGRIGRPMQVLTFGHHDEAAALSAVRERLSRRRSAPRRIGCPYRLVDWSGAEAEVMRWLREADLASRV